jgi:hypothetical protein
MKTQFKALMHCGRYVDANLLEGGIYTCEKPFIYSLEETIESMIERGKRLKDMAAFNFIPAKYFENLSKCELVCISIQINTEQEKPAKEREWKVGDMVRITKKLNGQDYLEIGCEVEVVEYDAKDNTWWVEDVFCTYYGWITTEEAELIEK